MYRCAIIVFVLYGGTCEKTSFIVIYVAEVRPNEKIVCQRSQWTKEERAEEVKATFEFSFIYEVETYFAIQCQ